MNDILECEACHNETPESEGEWIMTWAGDRYHNPTPPEYDFVCKGCVEAQEDREIEDYEYARDYPEDIPDYWDGS